MKKLFVIFCLIFANNVSAQEMSEDENYYAIIPDAPSQYTPGSVVSRMIDGLGFRYYWATQGLTEEDLEYKPTEGARTLAQTIDHIYGLSNTIVNSAKKQPTDFTKETPKMSYTEKRMTTLHNLKTASALFLASNHLSEHTITFVRPKDISNFPFWNHINGPIEDAVWHAGQVVVLRRAAGNPINPKVNVFLGKLND